MSASARHVAIITDGNGRWAQQRGLPVLEGHRAGADVVKERLRDAVDLGIEELTVFSFSTENWSRPREEVAGLMEMFGERIATETPELDEEGVRMRFIGRREGVAAELVERMEWAEAKTAENNRIALYIAFNYGGRAEIVDAARSFQGRGGEEEFRRHLYAPEMHDPDLLIRTSGESRISNYLLWQCAYSELVFRDELWPDFSRASLEESMAEFESRQRRFGARALMDLFDDELFDDEPAQRPRERRPPRGRRSRGRLRGETAKRILVAIPWIVFAIAIVVAGGIYFALAMIGIGLLCLREYLALTEELRPIQRAAYAAVPALILAAYFGTAFNVLLVLAAAFPVIFAFGVDRRHRDGIVGSMGVTLLGIVWIGIPLVHAVLLRDLPSHGAALMVDVLVGTFAADTGAYATGRMFGSHRIAPNLSPNKTLEGLIGGFLIGTMAFWFAGLYQDWLSGVDALLMGAAVAAIAPVGDLFESMLKRDLGKKDTGTLFGPHGGVLDRLDAVFFTIVVGYYLAVQLVY